MNEAGSVTLIRAIFGLKKEEVEGLHGDNARIEQLSAEIQEILLSLTPRESRVLEMRFGLGDGQPHTQREVGQRFGVSATRISQIQRKALRKLRYPTRSRRLRKYL